MGEDNVSRTEFIALKQTVEAHDQVIRGCGNDPGLVGNLSIVNKDVQSVYKDVQDLKANVREVKETLNGKNGHVGLVGNVEAIKNSIDSALKRNSDTAVTFKYVIDKFAAPVVTGVLIGLLMLFIK